MSSYRNGKPTGLTLTRLAGDLTLGSRFAAAQFARVHPNSVLNHCKHIACDIGTRAFLYDLDEAVEKLRRIRRAA